MHKPYHKLRCKYLLPIYHITWEMPPKIIHQAHTCEVLIAVIEYRRQQSAHRSAASSSAAGSAMAATSRCAVFSAAVIRILIAHSNQFLAVYLQLCDTH